jgi:hypothetical protein
MGLQRMEMGTAMERKRTEGTAAQLLQPLRRLPPLLPLLLSAALPPPPLM